MSLIETGEEVKFARSLVNPDKDVRDQTLQTLNKYATNLKKIDDVEMLKLWKGLYYCMWLSDKQEIQQELATALANLIDKFPTKVVALLYVRMFFRTMLREWFSLDQYRVNKFYTLIRLFINRTLSFVGKTGFKSDTMGEVLLILKEEALTKRPNGIRFHLADIFLQELVNVTEGDVTVPNFLTLIQPFIDTILSREDPVFIERVQNAVFNKFLEEFAGQNEVENEEVVLYTPNITLAVQKTLFDLASEESTAEPARKRLYALHKNFAQKSGISFVSDKDIADAKNASGGKVVRRPLEGLKLVARESKVEVTEPIVDKKKKKRTVEVSEEPESAIEEVPVVKTKKAKTEEKKSTKIEVAEKSDTVAAEKAVEKKTLKSSLKITESSEKTKDGKKNIKKNVEVVDTPAIDDTGKDFISSARFSGAKPGFVFHKGASGLGYYRDKPQPAKKVSFSGNNKKNKK